MRKGGMAMDKLLPKRMGWLVLSLALLFQACAPSASPTEPQPPEPTGLKVGTKPYLSYAPFFVAEEEGYFSEQGLEIEFIELDPRTTLPALMQGEVDVTAGLVSAGLLNAIARGGRIRIVADKGYVDPGACASFALVGRQTLVEAGEASDLAHFRGKQVDVLAGSWHNYYLAKLMATIGLSPEDLVLADLPSAAEGEALSRGALDFAVSGEPWLTRMLRAGHSSVLAPIQQIMPDAQYSVVLFGPNLLDESPDVGRRFVTAYLKAVQQLSLGKTERNIEVLAEQTGLEPAFLEEACWPAIRINGSINSASVLDFQAWAARSGLVEDPITIIQSWDSSFVDYASELLGSTFE
jgi:NitT/TauT family transport system substrate-binding protein